MVISVAADTIHPHWWPLFPLLVMSNSTPQGHLKKLASRRLPAWKWLSVRRSEPCREGGDWGWGLPGSPLGQGLFCSASFSNDKTLYDNLPSLVICGLSS